MATKRTPKQTTKRTTAKKALTAAEYKKLFDYIGKARTLCNRVANDDSKSLYVRTVMKSVDKKLYAISKDYYWGQLTNYAAGA